MGCQSRVGPFIALHFASQSSLTRSLKAAARALAPPSYPDPMTGVELAVPQRQAVGLTQSLALASAPPLSCALSDLLLLFSFCALESLSSSHFSESAMWIHSTILY